MFRKLEIANCYSFYNQTELSFIVNNKAPKTPRYAQSCVSDERLAKVVSIFGHNGSGKSSILKVIKFLKSFVLDSFGEKPDEELSIEPFLLKEKPFEPSTIKVEFECNNSVYRYFLSFSQNAVLKEELEILDLDQKQNAERRRFHRLFIREYDPEKNLTQVKDSPDFRINEGVKELVKLRKNASLISAGIFTNHEPSLALKSFWTGVITKIRSSSIRAYPPEYYLMKSTEFYHKNEQFKSKMESMMLRTDLGVVGVDIEKVRLPGGTESNTQEIYMPYGRHKGLKGKEYRLPFYYESGGTQQIYILLSTLLPALEKGGLAVIDELEADLHPEVLPVIFELFESEKTNPNKAQLIFTCHETTLLRILDKYQVVIVEKNEEGISAAHRTDADAVRSDDNLFSKYWAGQLGGKPNLTKE